MGGHGEGEEGRPASSRHDLVNKALQPLEIGFSPDQVHIVVVRGRYAIERLWLMSRLKRLPPQVDRDDRVSVAMDEYSRHRDLLEPVREFQPRPKQRIATQ